MPPTGKEKVRKRPQFTKMHCSQSPPQAQETPVAAAYWIDLGTRQPSITYRSHVSLGQRAREFLPSPAPCKYPIPKSSPQPQNGPTALLNKPTKPTRKTTPPSPSKSAHGASKSVYCPRALLTSSKTSSSSKCNSAIRCECGGLDRNEGYALTARDDFPQSRFLHRRPRAICRMDVPRDRMHQALDQIPERPFAFAFRHRKETAAVRLRRVPGWYLAQRPAGTAPVDGG
jgi:hypothetical protein